MKGQAMGWLRIPGVVALLGWAATALTLVEGAESSRLFLVDTDFVPPVARIYEVNPVTAALVLKGDLGQIYSPILAMAAADAHTFYLVGADNSPAHLCGVDPDETCLLLRVILDDVSTTPVLLEVVGAIAVGSVIQGGITGLSFRPDGSLYGISQDSDSLFRIDLLTAQATPIGSAGIDLYGGDLAFTRDDRLWLWTNTDGGEGLYSMSPATGAVLPYELHPLLDFSGLAGLGHDTQLFGSSAGDDRLYALDLLLGLNGGAPMTLSGQVFDHKRGDLDSPYCDASSGCGDGNECTVDACTPGGCRHFPIPGCCLDAGDCDDGSDCTADACHESRCVHLPSFECQSPLPEPRKRSREDLSH